MTIPRAILLLGPTGSGKTPLGDWLHRHGLAGQRCHHFDFGAQLRARAADGAAAGLSEAETSFIRTVLATGALLEDKDFPIAGKLIRGFLARRRVGPPDWVVLNGLPRHAGQARALEPVLDVRCVVELACDAATVRERLRRDTGGDRGGRVDDGAVLVEQKLALYAERTRPLIEHYRGRRSPLITIAVGTATTAADLARELERELASHRSDAL